MAKKTTSFKLVEKVRYKFYTRKQCNHHKVNLLKMEFTFPYTLPHSSIIFVIYTFNVISYMNVYAVFSQYGLDITFANTHTHIKRAGEREKERDRDTLKATTKITE